MEAFDSTQVGSWRVRVGDKRWDAFRFSFSELLAKNENWVSENGFFGNLECAHIFGLAGAILGTILHLLCAWDCPVLAGPVYAQLLIRWGAIDVVLDVCVGPESLIVGSRYRARKDG